MNRPSTNFFQRQDLFGGQGTVTIWNVFQEQAPPFSAVLWCELEVGGRVGAHRQQEDPEIILTLSGEGVAEVNREPHPMSVGAVVSLPFGAVLAIENRGD